MQSDNNRNMILAIVLSIVVLFGWQFLVAGPQLEQAQRRAEIAAQEQQAQQAAADAALGTPTVDGTTQAATPVINNGVTQAFADRATAVAASPRVTIDTPALAGSINLVGARLDDLQLKRYHETIDDNSPIITLLIPDGAPNGYFIEQGWTPPAGSTANVPDAQTQWTVESENQTLSPGNTVTLRWDNGEGLVFALTVSIDEFFMTALMISGRMACLAQIRRGG